MAKPKPKQNKKSAAAVTKVTPKKDAAPTWQDRFVEIFAMSLNVALAAQGAGVSRVSAYRERKKNPEFAAAWEDAREAAAERLEAAAFERARNISDTLLIFLLKSHKPERYRENYTQYNLNLNLSELSDEQLERIAAGEPPESVIRSGGSSIA